MAVKYSLMISDDYLIEADARTRGIMRSRWLRRPLKVFCALGMLALLALGIFAAIPVVIGIAVVFLTLLAAGPRFDYWALRRRWRKHPLLNQPFELTLDESEVTYYSSTTKARSSWSRYASATEFKDGVLCFSAPWDYFWLPDSGIVVGSAEDARALCRAKFTSYHVA
jgi:hypothetical protein